MATYYGTNHAVTFIQKTARKAGTNATLLWEQEGPKSTVIETHGVMAFQTMENVSMVYFQQFEHGFEIFMHVESNELDATQKALLERMSN